MELALVVWFISIVENLSTLFGYLCGASCAGAGIVIFIKLMSSADYEPMFVNTKLHVWLLVFAVFFGSLKALMPSEKQGYLIAGAYVTQKIAENEKVQDIGGKVLTLINAKLDEAISNKAEKK